MDHTATILPPGDYPPLDHLGDEEDLSMDEYPEPEDDLPTEPLESEPSEEPETETKPETEEKPGESKAFPEESKPIIVVKPLPSLEEEVAKLKAQIPLLEAAGVDESIIALVSDKLNKNLRKIEVNAELQTRKATLEEMEATAKVLRSGGDPELAKEIVALEAVYESLRADVATIGAELKSKRQLALAKGKDDPKVKEYEAKLAAMHAEASRWWGTLRNDEKPPEIWSDPFQIRKTRAVSGKPRKARGTGGAMFAQWSAVPLAKTLMESKMPDGSWVMPREEDEGITLAELRQRINTTGCLNDVMSVGRVIEEFDDPNSRAGLQFKKSLEMARKLGKQYRLTPVPGTGSNEHPEDTKFYAFEL